MFHNYANRLFYHNSLDQSISSRRDVWTIFLLLPCFKEIPAFNANSVGPDQTPHYATSDLGLHCYQCSFYGTPGLNGLMKKLLQLPISFPAHQK